MATNVYFINSQASVKVASTENGIIFGNIGRKLIEIFYAMFVYVIFIYTIRHEQSKDEIDKIENTKRTTLITVTQELQSAKQHTLHQYNARINRNQW